MHLVLRHYAGGMRTYNKHSFSFQACVNMKPNPSRVLHGSSLCKNEPIPILHLVIVVFIHQILLDEPWLFSSHRHHLFGRSYAFTCLFSFLEGPQLRVVLLANLLTITCFY